MEGTAFIGVAIADDFILRGKDEEQGKQISVDVLASKAVPSDANWSPATATTMDDEISVMSDEEGNLVSPFHSNVLLMGRFVQDDLRGVNAYINTRELESVRKASAKRIQRSFRLFRSSRRISEESGMYRQHAHISYQRRKTNESPKEFCQRPEVVEAEIQNSRARPLFLHPDQQEISDRQDEECTRLCVQKENFFQSSVNLRRHNAALSIQSYVRGYLARASLKEMGTTRQHSAAVSIQSYLRGCITPSWQEQKGTRLDDETVSTQSQLRGCIVRSLLKQRINARYRDTTLSIQSNLRGCSLRSSWKTQRTPPRTVLDAPSSMSREVWKEKHFKESIKSISPKSECKAQQSPARPEENLPSTGAQETNSTRTLNDFRSVLSFWESMGQQRTGNRHEKRHSINKGKCKNAVETKVKNKQQRASETISALHIQNRLHCNSRKKVECNGAIQIQRQPVALIAKRKVEERWGAKKKYQDSDAAHANGKKIREFVTHFSSSSSQPMKNCIATSVPLTRDKVSFFEPNPVRYGIGRIEQTITNGIQQEDFWRSQRVILQQGPC